MKRPKLTVNPDRIALDEAYMQMAEVWAKRSKANRLQVGALIVKDQQIISDGYNGMPAGMQGDDEVCEEYIMPPEYDGRDGIGGPPDPIVRTKQMVLHAEANAILKLARYEGRGADGATLYTTYSPCPDCAKLIKQAHIGRVVFRRHYRLPEGVEMLRKLGIECTQLSGGEEPQAPPVPKKAEPIKAAWPYETPARKPRAKPVKTVKAAPKEKSNARTKAGQK